MKADLLAGDAPRWASFLADARHDFYHLPGYVELCAVPENGQPVALIVEDGDRSMLLPMIIRPIPGGTTDAISPYGYPGPLLRGTDDPAFLGDALAAGAAMLGARGVVSLFVRLHPLLNPTPPTGVGTVVRHGDTVSVDLTLPTDELWRQTRSGHRNEINRARRLGRVASFDDSWRRYDDFKELYGTTMARVEASASYLFDDAYFDGLRAALGDRLRLCVVEAGEDVAAAALFVETCGIVQFHLSGTDSRFSHEGPTKLMIDFVRAWAKDRGDLRLHLGGGLGASDDSLFQFKAGFSHLRHAFHTLRMVCDEREYARLALAHDPAADPTVLDGFFPLYRTP